MNILIQVGSKCWPGYYEAVSMMATCLRKRDHRVKILNTVADYANWFDDNTDEVIEDYWALVSKFQKRVRFSSLEKSDAGSSVDVHQMTNLSCMIPQLHWSRRRNVSQDGCYSRISATLLLLMKYQPDCVLLYNGWTSCAYAMQRICSRLGIRTVFMEKGLLPYSFQLDRKGVNGGSSIAEETGNPQPLTSDQMLDLEQVRSELFQKGKTGWSQTTNRIGAKQLKAELGIDETTKVIFYVGQIDVDSNLVLFSPNARSNAAGLRLLMSALPKKMKWFILGKQHPLDKADATQCRSIIAEYGVWRKDIHLHDCLELADIVVSINSSVVLEAVLLKKPTILLGKSVFSNKGLTFDYDATRHKELCTYMRSLFSESYRQNADSDYWSWRIACDWLYRCDPARINVEIERACKFIEKDLVPVPESCWDDLQTMIAELDSIPCINPNVMPTQNGLELPGVSSRALTSVLINRLKHECAVFAKRAKIRLIKKGC